jgi:hypothetical protein
VDEPLDASHRHRSGPPPHRAFGPDLRYTAAAGLGALLLAVIVLVTTDAAGRLLFGAAALLLLGYVVCDLTFRPRLVFGPDGLRVHSPLSRVSCAWDDVEAVRADTRSRYGLRAVTLEIDTSETLVVLSRRALGADPELVAAFAGEYR